MRRTRLDVELVRRGLAASREQAAAAIAEGRVSIAGLTATKAATAVDTAVALVVAAPAEGEIYVSRGGHKLAGALDRFSEIDPAGKRCLDAGASTGGFTDVLLRRGAREVIAVDVGYGQIAWSLRTDDRVVVIERTNVRAITPDDIGGQVELVVGDLSFISLTTVLPALASCADASADMLLLVKPQFEVGKERLGAGGVVRDPTLRADAVRTVAAKAYSLGWGCAGVVRSPLPGPAGNVEFVIWLRKGEEVLDETQLSTEVCGEIPGTEVDSVEP